MKPIGSGCSLKVLRVIPTLDPAFGGPVAALSASVDEMSARGVQTDIIVTDRRHPGEAAFANSVRVLHFGPSRTAWRLVRGLQPWLKDNVDNYDLVILHGIWPYGSYAASVICRRKRVRYFAFVHGSLDPWYRKGQPVKYLKKWLTWPWVQYPMLRDAAGVLFTTEQERDLASRSFRPYACTPIVVRYGISEAIEADGCSPADPPYLLYLGRIHPKKGVDLLVKATHQLAGQGLPWQFVVAGDWNNSYGRSVRNMAKSLGVADAFTWVGQADADEKWRLLAGAKALVLPSHTENFGVVVAEALSCGTPALVSDKVNIAGLVASSGAGLVCNDNEAGVAAMLRDFAATSANVHGEMRLRARELYEQHFTIAGAVDDLLALISPVS